MTLSTAITLALLLLVWTPFIVISLVSLLPHHRAYRMLGGLAKWVQIGFAGRALYAWWRTRHVRSENAGRFLENSERNKLLSPKYSGLLLDGTTARLTEENSCKNLALIATTGSGKTASYILPNLFSLDNASIVATDPSGKLFESTSGDLRKRGYKVYQLNPTDLFKSIAYNPLARANTHTEMQEIAHILVRTSNGSAHVDPFWSQSAEEILGILIKCLKSHVEADTYANLANLQYLLNIFGTGEPLLGFVAANAPDKPTHTAFKSFIMQSEKTLQGIISQAKSALTKLSDPNIAKLTGTNSFDFESLRREKTAIFLVFPQSRISYYSFLANLFYTQLFHYCLDDAKFSENSLPIYCLLDEFGHLTIPDFPAIITTTRQRRVSLSIVLQSISQLEQRYGKDGAKTILTGGIASHLYFSGMDIDTASMLARTIGDVHRERVDAFGVPRIERESLMTPAAIRAMPDNQVLYLFSNKRPILLEVTPYFTQKDLQRRSKTAPYVPAISAIKPVMYVPL